METGPNFNTEENLHADTVAERHDSQREDDSQREAFVVIDFETTDREPEKAHIVEWAAIVLYQPWFGVIQRETLHGGLVKPPVPIPAETSAVHHIIDADVAGSPRWDDEQGKLAELLRPEGRIAVAHNAEFERRLLARHGPMIVGGKVPWLCTYKAACRVWPDAPGHSNEILRYHLGLGTGRSKRQATHSALHDAQVTAALLQELLKASTPIKDMLTWAEEPAMIPTCPLGDWRGKKWSEVDEGFLLWICRKISDRPDVVFCAKAELDRRDAERLDPATAWPFPKGT